MDYVTLRKIFAFLKGSDFLKKTDREDTARVVLRHDLMWRTVSGLGAFRKRVGNYDDLIIKNTAELVFDYMTGPCPKTAKEFDDWHKNACLKVLNEYNNTFKTLGAYTKDGSLIQIKYGKAQKAINMTLKNFALMDNAATYIDHCEFAHLPIDSIVLKWLKQHGCITGYFAWSNLDYGTYINIQNSARKYVLSNSATIKREYSAQHPSISLTGFSNPLTLFEAETLIWDMYQ